jgi:hypothetical protein
MTDLTVTPLICPDPACNRALSGLGEDKLFACMPCACVYSFEGGKRGRFDLTFAELPRDTDGLLFYLPFWNFQIQVAVLRPGEPNRPLGVDLAEIDTVWVAAYLMYRPEYHGDPGLILTDHRVRVQEATSRPEGLIVAGITRGFDEALGCGKMFVTSMIDRADDVTGMEITIKVQSARLWALPFLDQGEQVVDLTTNVKVPRHAIGDLDEILELSNRR